MLFLVEYDRALGEIATFRTFADSDRKLAEDSRLDLELALRRRGIDHEVVLLEAASEEALRRTHRRYFESLQELATAPS
jgi:hypothetical protein